MESTSNAVTKILNHEMRNGTMTVQVQSSGRTEWETLQDCMQRDLKVVEDYYTGLPDDNKDEFYEQMESNGLLQIEAFKERERDWLRSGNVVARIGYGKDDSADSDDNLNETPKEEKKFEVKAILGHENVGGHVHLIVSWKNYPESDSSSIPVGNMVNKTMVNKYLKKIFPNVKSGTALNNLEKQYQEEMMAKPHQQALVDEGGPNSIEPFMSADALSAVTLTVPKRSLKKSAKSSKNDSKRRKVEVLASAEDSDEGEQDEDADPTSNVSVNGKKTWKNDVAVPPAQTGVGKSVTKNAKCSLEEAIKKMTLVVTNLSAIPYMHHQGNSDRDDSNDGNKEETSTTVVTKKEMEEKKRLKRTEEALKVMTTAFQAMSTMFTNNIQCETKEDSLAKQMVKNYTGTVVTMATLFTGNDESEETNEA